MKTVGFYPTGLLEFVESSRPANTQSVQLDTYPRIIGEMAVWKIEYLGWRDKVIDTKTFEVDAQTYLKALSEEK